MKRLLRGSAGADGGTDGAPSSVLYTALREGGLSWGAEVLSRVCVNDDSVQNDLIIDLNMSDNRYQTERIITRYDVWRDDSTHIELTHQTAVQHPPSVLWIWTSCMQIHRVMTNQSGDVWGAVTDCVPPTLTH